MVTKREVMAELKKVVDPEIGIPVTEMKLIDEVKIKGSDVEVQFHLTTPFCPPIFARQIALDIREKISKMKGVKSVKVTLKDHFMADQINEEVNR